MTRAWLLLLAACATAQSEVKPDAAPPPPPAPVAPVCPTALPKTTDDVAPLVGARIDKVCLLNSTEDSYLRLHELVAPREGEALDLAHVRDDLEQLFATGVVRGVEAVATPLDGKRVVLAYFVDEYPLVANVRVTGPEAFTEDQLREALVTGKRASAAELASLRNAVTEFYLDRGFPRVAVVVGTAKLEGGKVEVVVQVGEGERWTIEAIRFVGAKKLKEAELKKVLKSSVGQVWREAVSELDAAALSSLYYDRGMVNVSIKPSLEGRALVFTISEGEVYRLGKLSLTGFELPGGAEVLKALESKRGAVFSRATLQRDLERIKDRAAKKGLKALAMASGCCGPTVGWWQRR
jgi:outer membrane protein insertion porin family